MSKFQVSSLWFPVVYYLREKRSLKEAANRKTKPSIKKKSVTLTLLKSFGSDKKRFKTKETVKEIIEKAIKTSLQASLPPRSL